MKYPDAPATESQENFLRGLAYGKVIPNYDGPDAWKFVVMMKDQGKLTRKFASDLIDMWTKLPDRKYEPGYFRLQTDPATEPVFIQVVENRAKTGTYTKVWNGGGWEFAPDHKKFLAESTAMTTEEMAKFGHITGRCIVCSATLTDDDSIKRGLGPVCAKRVGLL